MSATRLITKDTAAAIAYAYCEIEASETLLSDLAKAKENRTEPDFRDVFGKMHRSLELGVPCGETSRRVFRVNPDLAEIIIKAHADQMRAKIAALTALAVQETRGDAP